MVLKAELEGHNIKSPTLFADTLSQTKSKVIMMAYTAIFAEERKGKE